MPTTGLQFTTTDADFPETCWPQLGGDLNDERLFNMLYDDINMKDFDSSSFGTASYWPAAPNIEGPSSRQVMDQSDATAAGIFRLDKNTMAMTPAATPPQTQRVNPATPTALDRMHSSRKGGASPQAFSSVPGKLGDSAAARNPPALMQRMMQLGSGMYELQSIYSIEQQGSQPRTATSPDTFPTELTGKVLQAAIEVLKTLRCFFPDNPSTISSTSSFKSRRGLSMADVGDVEDRNYHRLQVGGYPSFSDSNSHTSPSTASNALGEWPIGQISGVDKAATLQLIANYQGLLKLYLLLYSTIYDYVLFTGSGVRQSQPIWNNLTIGDAPLFQFADLQIKMVLQVAARLLKDIETTLGLSHGCRVSKRSANEGNGILGVNASTHFIEMCMSEVTTGSEQGRSAIVRLKDIMHCLMNLLDEHSWP